MSRDHGSTRYREGCRCAVCRRAMADAAADRRNRKYLLRTDSLSVPNLGTKRRIQSLVALGWSLSEISRQAGWDRSHAALILRRKGPVHRTTHDRVAELYARLSETLPPTETTQQRIDASRARNIAKRKGWLPPIWWDDLDDPDERPRERTRTHGEGDWEDYIDHATVWRVVNETTRPRKLTRAESQEVVRVLLARGVSTHVMRDLYGIKAERFVTLSERTAS